MLEFLKIGQLWSRHVYQFCNRPAAHLACGGSEPSLLELFAEAFEDADFDVLRAGSGDIAAERLPSIEALDGLVTDIRMPGSLDGFGIARRVREKYSAVPVIFISATWI